MMWEDSLQRLRNSSRLYRRTWEQNTSWNQRTLSMLGVRQWPMETPTDLVKRLTIPGIDGKTVSAIGRYKWQAVGA